VVDMMSWFEKGGLLHYRYAYELVSEATQIFDEYPNVVQVQFPKDGRITVCGDLHGQFNDLFTIFRLNGRSFFFLFIYLFLNS
jgi:serine/threonine-protein phosphatase 5